MRSISTILLLGLSLFTALILETKMSAGFTAELIIILLSIIFMAGVIFGLWIDAEWAYPLASILFAAGLANLAWLFYHTHSFLAFAFGLLVNVAGLVLCIINNDEPPRSYAATLETYDIADIKQELEDLRASRKQSPAKRKTKKTKKRRKKKTKKKRR